VRVSLGVSDEDIRRIRTSFRLPKELDELVFLKDTKEFAKCFKGSAVPPRIRVRLYFVKAICILGKPGGVDPYLKFNLGTKYEVSMRNTPAYGQTKPEFYRVEERDIELPRDSRLQIDMFDLESAQDVLGQSAANALGRNDQIIGSTIIDLEDRWHSRNWQDSARRQQVPTEQRPLMISTLPGHNCGSIEMWVEMLDSVHASDQKATDLRAPPQTEIEIRLVIRTTTAIPLVDNGKCDVKITVRLECKEYQGHLPMYQETDVHNGCTTGNAVFNWRIVYPRIQMPTQSCTLDIQCWDANSLASDTLVGMVSIDVRKYVEKVARDLEALTATADLALSPPAAEEGEEKEASPGDPSGEGQDPAGRVQFEFFIYTQSEANEKKAGWRRDPPNENPPLVTPAEGRGWGDVFAGFSFSLPSFGLFAKVVPLIIFTLLCLVGLKFVGLL
jgi:hypothetical protein